MFCFFLPCLWVSVAGTLCFFFVPSADYVPDGLSDFANALANPIKYQSELEKRAKQLSILTGETEDPSEVDTFVDVAPT